MVYTSVWQILLNLFRNCIILMLTAGLLCCDVYYPVYLKILSCQFCSKCDMVIYVVLDFWIQSEPFYLSVNINIPGLTTCPNRSSITPIVKFSILFPLPLSQRFKEWHENIIFHVSFIRFVHSEICLKERNPQFVCFWIDSWLNGMLANCTVYQ